MTNIVLMNVNSYYSVLQNDNEEEEWSYQLFFFFVRAYLTVLFLAYSSIGPLIRKQGCKKVSPENVKKK